MKGLPASPASVDLQLHVQHFECRFKFRGVGLKLGRMRGVDCRELMCEVAGDRDRVSAGRARNARRSRRPWPCSSRSSSVAIAHLVQAAFADWQKPKTGRLLKLDHPRLCGKRGKRPFEKNFEIFGDEYHRVRFA